MFRGRPKNDTHEEPPVVGFKRDPKKRKNNEMHVLGGAQNKDTHTHTSGCDSNVNARYPCPSVIRHTSLLELLLPTVDDGHLGSANQTDANL